MTVSRRVPAIPPLSVRSGILLSSLLLWGIITIWHWRIIYSGILSCVLTPYVLMTTDDVASRYLRAEFTDCWIASLVWLFSCVVLLRMLVKSPQKDSAEVSFPGSGTSGKGVGGRGIALIIFLFAVVGIAAPIIVPLDPTTQGDLRKMKFLKPFEWGTSDHVIPSESTVAKAPS